MIRWDCLSGLGSRPTRHYAFTMATEQIAGNPEVIHMSSCRQVVLCPDCSWNHRYPDTGADFLC